MEVAERRCAAAQRTGGKPAPPMANPAADKVAAEPMHVGIHSRMAALQGAEEGQCKICCPETINGARSPVV